MKNNLKNAFRFIVILSVFQFALFINSNGQTVSGQVIDSDDKFGINAAEIIVEHSGVSDTVYSDNNGKWIYSISANADEIIQPNEFSLYQNYPNPFNPSTIISFSISKTSEVKISVHNILGQEIDSKSAVLNSGFHSINWDGKGSAGIYFYTITVDGYSMTKKMVQLDGHSGSGLSGFQSSSVESKILSKYNSSKIGINSEFVIFTNKFGYVSDTLVLETAPSGSITTEIRTVHSKSVLVDLHNDILEIMLEDKNYHLADLHNYNHTDIPRLQKGKVDVQFFAVWVNPTSYSANAFQKANEMFDLLDSEIFSSADKIQIAKSYSEIQSNIAQNKISAVFGVEGGHAIENDLKKLEQLYNKGMRYLTITWNNSTDWAVSAADSRSSTVGLSDFGKRVIQKMDSLGVIIDVSHTGIKTIKDILQVTKNPIIATHSGVRAIQNHSRNLYDYQIRDIASSGGVIGIVFYPPFLGNVSSAVDIGTVIKHIDYIVNLVGIDYVAIGSDFDGIGTNTVNGLEDVTKFPDLTIELLKHGYTQNDVEKILGKNFLRVFKQVVK
ncbi:MAG: hypothetical protein CO129_08850 [Ignavibacteriales bacterium CG_4_9_14_3_um_filter_34_10]|nr:MAG: hypothetical protein CO129_08850 [Ignavibacteriales bacterium CG_4_9_14_3_um_filter_34_10]